MRVNSKAQKANKECKHSALLDLFMLRALLSSHAEVVLIPLFLVLAALHTKYEMDHMKTWAHFNIYAVIAAS